jgi:hypothetical protein
MVPDCQLLVLAWQAGAGAVLPFSTGEGLPMVHRAGAALGGAPRRVVPSSSAP